MNIVIFATTEFPEGGATASRLKMVSKCLIEAGNNVTIAIFNPSFKVQPAGNKTTKGVYDSIEYCYLSNKTIRPSYFIGTFLDILRGILYSLIFLHNKKKKVEVDVVYLYNPNLINCFLCIFLCKLYHIPIIAEINEVESKCENKNSLKHKFMRVGYFLSEMFISRIASGFVIISTRIKDFYVNKRVDRQRIFILPILVNFDFYQIAFKAEIEILKNKTYYLYSGSFDEKDGLKYIIKAFSEVLKKSPNLYLVFTGYPFERNIQHLKNIISNLNLSDKIIFTGYISTSELVWSYQNSLALLCCRSNSEYANFGFPTKLGEYLSVGKPVIATKVGDMELYLNDRESAFLAEAENVRSISQKMIEILEYSDVSSEVSKKGKLVAKNVFDYKNYIYSLDIFIKRIIDSFAK